MIVEWALVQWLANGERGASSNAIVQHLTGIRTSHYEPCAPQDPADLRRCRLLLARVPSLAWRIGEMASCSPEWARLVLHWQELCALMDDESPGWSEGVGRAPKTYALMRKLLSAAVEAGDVP
jgi:hypothetical protein